MSPSPNRLTSGLRDMSLVRGPSLWDVVSPDPTNFVDRPLANAPQGVTAGQPHWWESTALTRMADRAVSDPSDSWQIVTAMPGSMLLSTIVLARNSCWTAHGHITCIVAAASAPTA